VIDYEDLARAASESDTLSERVGLEEVLSRLGLDVEGVVKAAEQRAMRCVLAATRDEEKMAQVAEAATAGKYFALELTAEQKAMLPVAQLGIIDGIVMGARVGRPRFRPIDGGHRR
jgi:hypothetical protein